MSAKDKRREEIVRIVDSKGSISFRELHAKFALLSEVTLRSDLKELDAQRKIVRTYGGAKSLRSAVGFDLPMNQRVSQEAESKELIAQKAAGLVREGSTIYLDSGSTTAFFSQKLPDQQTTVFTSSISCVNELMHRRNITTIVPGGTLNQASMCLDGSETIAAVQKLNFEQLFLGTTGYSNETGLTCELSEQAHLKRACISRSEEVILLMDSSKVGKWGTFCFSRLEDLDVLVSDGRLPKEFLKACKRAGVEVL